MADEKKITPAKGKNTNADAAEAKLKNSLYGKAQTILKDRYEAEFEDILSDLYAEHGLERKRKLTPEQKAARDLEAIYEQFPHLRPVETLERVDAGTNPEAA